MDNILQNIRNYRNRNSTKQNYLGIWQNFNKFLIRLDSMPKTWEHRVLLYCGHLIHQENVQSSTLKSYVSAIKDVLSSEDYHLNVDKLIFSALINSCRNTNDVVTTRLPIMSGLLMILLTETENIYADKQPYLELLYKNILSLLFFGLFRIGELTMSNHTLKAKDVHISFTSQKLMFILYSSKTHGRESQPQQIRISSQKDLGILCPFDLSRKYHTARGGYYYDNEPYFIFRDRTAVTPQHIRNLMRTIFGNINLDPKLYGTHSFRIGRATELFKQGMPFEKIKQLGRWRSNAIYKYLRN